MDGYDEEQQQYIKVGSQWVNKTPNEELIKDTTDITNNSNTNRSTQNWTGAEDDGL